MVCCCAAWRYVCVQCVWTPDGGPCVTTHALTHALTHPRLRRRRPQTSGRCWAAPRPPQPPQPPQPPRLPQPPAPAGPAPGVTGAEPGTKTTQTVEAAGRGRGRGRATARRILSGVWRLGPPTSPTCEQWCLEDWVATAEGAAGVVAEAGAEAEGLCRRGRCRRHCWSRCAWWAVVAVAEEAEDCVVAGSLGQLGRAGESLGGCLAPARHGVCVRQAGRGAPLPLTAGCGALMTARLQVEAAGDWLQLCWLLEAAAAQGVALGPRAAAAAFKQAAGGWQRPMRGRRRRRQRRRRVCCASALALCKSLGGHVAARRRPRGHSVTNASLPPNSRVWSQVWSRRKEPSPAA